MHVHVSLPPHTATHPRIGPVPSQKNRGQNGATSFRECTFGVRLPTVVCCSLKHKLALERKSRCLFGNSPEARNITCGVLELRLLTLEVDMAGVLCVAGRMETDILSGM